jgi:tRNA A37 N6-isopentenylltransferase MiaA
MLTNLNTNFNKLWKYIAAGGTMLAYQALAYGYDRIKSKNALIEQKSDSQATIIKKDIIEVKEFISKNIVD